MSNEEKKKWLTEMLDFCHICDDKAELAQDILHEYIASIDEWEAEKDKLQADNQSLVEQMNQMAQIIIRIKGDLI